MFFARKLNNDEQCIYCVLAGMQYFSVQHRIDTYLRIDIITTGIVKLHFINASHLVMVAFTCVKFKDTRVTHLYIGKEKIASFMLSVIKS